MLIYSQEHTLSGAGVNNTFVASSSWFFDAGSVYPNPHRAGLFSNKVESSKGPLFLDIEHTIDPAVIDACVDMYRTRYPNIRLGWYGSMPSRKYLPKGEDRESWLKENLQQRIGRGSLASKFDVVCPSLYTFYLDKTSWGNFAREMLNESGKYQKPIIAFVSHQLRGADDYIGDDMLKFQLRLLREHPSKVEGLFFWSKPDSPMPDSAVKIVKEMFR